MDTGDYKFSYEKYIYTPTNNSSFYNNDSSSFIKGGMLNLEEFKITLKNNTRELYYSYFYEGNPFWNITAGASVVYAGGDKVQTRSIFVLDSAGNKELIQQMSYYHGDTAFNFLNSRINTWFSQNSGSTVPPWESKVYDHNSDGTLTLTLRVDLMMLPSNSSFSASCNNVDNTITLTDLR